VQQEPLSIDLHGVAHDAALEIVNVPLGRPRRPRYAVHHEPRGRNGIPFAIDDAQDDGRSRRSG
jgi:hypothetical protein